MKSIVPFYSQYGEDVPDDWKPKTCGIMALRMAVESKIGGKLNAKELIETGVTNGAYITGIGWRHDGLVALAMKNGAQAYRKEFADVGEGLDFVKSAMQKEELVIVSIRVDNKRDTHLILLTNIGEENGEKGFYYNDSAERTSASGQNLFLSEIEFTRVWRKLAIFVA